MDVEDASVREVTGVTSVTSVTPSPQWAMDRRDHLDVDLVLLPAKGRQPDNLRLVPAKSSASRDYDHLRLVPAKPSASESWEHAFATHSPFSLQYSPQKRQRVVSIRTERSVRPRTEPRAPADEPAPEPSGPSPEPENADPQDNFATFVESVVEGIVGFFQISKTLFVVQGWDKKTASGTVC